MDPSRGKCCNSSHFREDLQQILNTIVDNVHMSTTTSPLPVAIDGSRIAEQFAQAVSSQSYLVCSSDTTHGNEQVANWQKQHAGGLGSLLRLPREIRDMIYHHMIADGNINIMPCSSALAKETSELVFNHGICRLNLNFAENMTLVPAIDPNQDIADKIQNLSIRVNTRCNGTLGRPTPQVDILSKFSGSTIPRKRCTVSFECWPTTLGMVARDVLKKLRTLTGFEEMRITIDLEWMGEAWPEGLLPFQVSQICGSIRGGFLEAKHELEGTLGEGDLGWDEEDERLLFFPRMARGEAVMGARKALGL
ncbi:hypothetical protein N7G274_008097 [Stereocaulon virgatum]|uniref:F-box domain-containing protein n=1 Tax=Stereocaulon virgatum TaxID=373712 RepID=A0ABR4A1Y6_9LECA